MSHPTTLLLIGGREVKVVKVCYPYGKGQWRVTYEHGPNHPKGCIAELWPGRWQEVEPLTPIRSSK